MNTSTLEHIKRLKSHLRKGIELADKATPTLITNELEYFVGFGTSTLIAHACNSHKAHCEAVLISIQFLEDEMMQVNPGAEVALDLILAKYPHI